MSDNKKFSNRVEINFSSSNSNSAKNNLINFTGGKKEITSTTSNNHINLNESMVSNISLVSNTSSNLNLNLSTVNLNSSIKSRKPFEKLSFSNNPQVNQVNQGNQGNLLAQNNNIQFSEKSKIKNERNLNSIANKTNSINLNTSHASLNEIKSVYENTDANANKDEIESKITSNHHTNNFNELNEEESKKANENKDKQKDECIYNDSTINQTEKEKVDITENENFTEDDSDLPVFKENSQLILEEGEVLLNDEDQSFIKSLFNSKKLTKEEIIKAIKYNNGDTSFQNNENMPFWVKYFISNLPLKENSSFFKSKNKEEYINNMISMIKNDARLYDSTSSLRQAKEKSKEELKNLLITEVVSDKQNSKDLKEKEESYSKENSNTTILSNTTTTSKKKKTEEEKLKKEKENLKQFGKLNQKIKTFYTEKYENNKKEEREEKEEQKSFISERTFHEILIKETTKTTSIIEKNKEIDYCLQRFKGSEKRLEKLESLMEKNEEIETEPKWLSIRELKIEANEINIPEGCLLFYRTENLSALAELDKKLKEKEKIRKEFEENCPTSTNNKNFISSLIETKKQAEEDKERELSKIKEREKLKEKEKEKPKTRETVLSVAAAYGSKVRNQTKIQDIPNNESLIYCNTILELRKQRENDLQKIEEKCMEKMEKEVTETQKNEYLNNVVLQETDYSEIDALEEELRNMTKSLDRLNSTVQEIKKNEKKEENENLETKKKEKEMKEKVDEEIKQIEKDEKILEEIIVDMNQALRANHEILHKIEEVEANKNSNTRNSNEFIMCDNEKIRKLKQKIEENKLQFEESN